MPPVSRHSPLPSSTGTSPPPSSSCSTGHGPVRYTREVVLRPSTSRPSGRRSSLSNSCWSMEHLCRCQCRVPVRRLCISPLNSQAIASHCCSPMAQSSKPGILLVLLRCSTRCAEWHRCRHAKSCSRLERRQIPPIIISNGHLSIGYASLVPWRWIAPIALRPTRPQKNPCRLMDQRPRPPAGLRLPKHLVVLLANVKERIPPLQRYACCWMPRRL
mmetsp:Transcript_4837/g.14633  ORF Transcript_4837/g.14633 Transcript_4837/m.14633 type:complete len:216 (+) Transcript_4837:1658-2305(+)